MDYFYAAWGLAGRLFFMKYIFIVLLLVACNSKPDVKAQFDNLEKVFETGNWEMVLGSDTIYSFFSREGERFFKVYSYRIEDGDSVRSRITTIQPENGKIVWSGSELVSATDKESVWKHPANGEFRVKKLDSLHILFNGDTLIRTLPISTFLVRSKYDFLHGTHTADALVDTVRRRR